MIVGTHLFAQSGTGNVIVHDLAMCVGYALRQATRKWGNTLMIDDDDNGTRVAGRILANASKMLRFAGMLALRKAQEIAYACAGATRPVLISEHRRRHFDYIISKYSQRLMTVLSASVNSDASVSLYCVTFV